MMIRRGMNSPRMISLMTNEKHGYLISLEIAILLTSAFILSPSLRPFAYELLCFILIFAQLSLCGKRF